MFKISSKIKKYIIIIILSISLYSVSFVLNIPSAVNNTENINPIKQKQLYTVLRVVDGDTISVSINNEKKKIRIIGLNTPEAYDFKDRVRECFGKEASKKAKEILSNETVFLEIDDTQSKVDKYGRLLRHVFLKDGTNFAEVMISEGYGKEYTYKGIAHKYQKKFLQAQEQAKKTQSGLWNPQICP